MIVSAVSLWKKFKLKTPLDASEWGIEEKDGKIFSHVSFSGHRTTDGVVRIYAQFSRPKGSEKRPAILLLPDAGELLDRELMDYFVDKGYAVLTPDYSGKMKKDKEGTLRTLYPASLSYANYEKADLYEMKETEAEKTAWFEWTYVALFALEYLKSRAEVGPIGVVGIRKGGDIAWQTMLSPSVKCGIPVNAPGWRSFLNVAKFGEDTVHNMSDETRRYIAAVEAQSYAPYVKCPVLMLCALRDKEIDCDRAYDTYSRIGNTDENALVYSVDTEACIGPNALIDMDLFLEKNLKGREIYIPDTLNVSLSENKNGLLVKVEGDKEGILQEVGVYYAEADVSTKSNYRDWRCIYKTDGSSVKNNEIQLEVKPFAGAKAAFVYGYAKYINGFRVMSKIVGKRLSSHNAMAIKSRKLFSGSETDCFGVAEYKEYSVGGIFLERTSVPKTIKGYGDINGAFSVSGIKTYKISSPKYVPDENALLEFDVYAKTDETVFVSIEVADVKTEIERYTCPIPVKGGGKWKRIILKPGDFKGETYSQPLKSFKDGNSLLFDCEREEGEFAVANILWL